MPPKKLNLGCGNDIRAGWINLDSVTLPGVDIVHDIEILPLPFREEEFDEILCHDILEHVDYIPILRELHRILKPGGAIMVRVPHFTSKNNYIDPSHRKLFSVSTFDFFTRNTKLKTKRGYYLNFAFSQTQSRRITFERSSRLFFYNRLIETLVNASPRIQTLYESTGFSRLFPAENIILTLIK